MSNAAKSAAAVAPSILEVELPVNFELCIKCQNAHGVLIANPLPGSYEKFLAAVRCRSSLGYTSVSSWVFLRSPGVLLRSPSWGRIEVSWGLIQVSWGRFEVTLGLTEVSWGLTKVFWGLTQASWGRIEVTWGLAEVSTPGAVTTPGDLNKTP